MRIRQKLILLTAAVAVAAMLGLSAHALDLSGTVTSVVAGVALGLLVALGAPYAFDMSAKPTGVSLAIAGDLDQHVQMVAESTLADYLDQQHLHLAAERAFTGPGLVLGRYRLESRRATARLLVAVLDEKTPRGPSIRFTLMASDPDGGNRVMIRTVDLERDLTSAPARRKAKCAPAPELGRFVVPEAKRRRHRPELALRTL